MDTTTQNWLGGVFPDRCPDVVISLFKKECIDLTAIGLIPEADIKDFLKPLPMGHRIKLEHAIRKYKQDNCKEPAVDKEFPSNSKGFGDDNQDITKRQLEKIEKTKTSAKKVNELKDTYKATLGVKVETKVVKRETPGVKQETEVQWSKPRKYLRKKGMPIRTDVTYIGLFNLLFNLLLEQHNVDPKNCVLMDSKNNIVEEKDFSLIRYINKNGRTLLYIGIRSAETDVNGSLATPHLVANHKEELLASMRLDHPYDDGTFLDEPQPAFSGGSEPAFSAQSEIRSNLAKLDGPVISIPDAHEAPAIQDDVQDRICESDPTSPDFEDDVQYTICESGPTSPDPEELDRCLRSSKDLEEYAHALSILFPQAPPSDNQKSVEGTSGISPCDDHVNGSFLDVNSVPEEASTLQKTPVMETQTSPAAKLWQTDVISIRKSHRTAAEEGISINSAVQPSTELLRSTTELLDMLNPQCEGDQENLDLLQEAVRLNGISLSQYLQQSEISGNLTVWSQPGLDGQVVSIPDAPVAPAILKSVEGASGISPRGDHVNGGFLDVNNFTSSSTRSPVAAELETADLLTLIPGSESDNLLSELETADLLTLIPGSDLDNLISEFHSSDQELDPSPGDTTQLFHSSPHPSGTSPVRQTLHQQQQTLKLLSGIYGENNHSAKVGERSPPDPRLVSADSNNLGRCNSTSSRPTNDVAESKNRKRKKEATDQQGCMSSASDGKSPPKDPPPDGGKRSGKRRKIKRWEEGLGLC